jgi:DNA-binding PadR family transcriptional regulator
MSRLRRWDERVVGLFNTSMAANPLCPVVLSMIAARPRPVHEVARDLRDRTLRQTDECLAARTALERLQAAGLVHASGDRTAGRVFRLTTRGRGELSVQRLLWARLASTAITTT